MREKSKWMNLLLALCFSMNSYSQNFKVCEEELPDRSFISDGQDHQVLLRYNKITKLNIVFYPQFRYRLVLCCHDKSLPVEFKLMDTKGSIHYTNANKDYIRTWDFQFTSIMNAIVELKLADTHIKEENVEIFISYQTFKTL